MAYRLTAWPGLGTVFMSVKREKKKLQNIHILWKNNGDEGTMLVVRAGQSKE